MSKQPVQQAMERFLASHRREAILVTGAWGTGKTHLWQTVLKRGAKTYGGIALENYSYVSLYGLKDLEELKFAIFANSIGRDSIGNENVEPFERLTKKAAKPIAQILSVIPMMGNASKLIAPTLAMTVSKTIICIDDLERKSAELTLRDVLGLVTFLKEERQCKIIMLSNADVLGEEKPELDASSEKVFDRTLVFSPTAAECADIIKAEGELRDHLIQLDISNIRIARKVQTLLDEVKGQLDECVPAVLSQAARDLVILGWMKYGADAPPRYFLTDRNALHVGKAQGASPNPKHALWASKVDKYMGFGSTNALTHVLAQGLDAGYFNKLALQEAASFIDTSSQKLEADARRSKHWSKVRTSFASDDGTLIDKLIAVVRDDMTYVYPTELNRVLLLLRSLNRPEDATSLIDRYVTAHAGKAAAFDIRQHSRVLEPITDEQLLSRMAAELNQLGESPSSLSPIDAILSIGRNNGGEEETYRLGAAATPAQIADHFRSIEGPEFEEFLGACFWAQDVSNANDDARRILDNTLQAMRLLSQDSRLNAYRVRMLNIDPSAMASPSGTAPPQQVPSSEIGT